MMSRLATRRVAGRVAALRARGMSNLAYTERMDKTGRPVSPAVTIYRFPSIALSSITVRITGGMLTVGVGGVAAMSLFGSPDAAYSMAQCIGSSSIAPLAKFAVAFPLTYHFMGGIRHAVWDLTAKGFTNQHMLMSSYAIFGASTILSLALATYSLPEKKTK